MALTVDDVMDKIGSFGRYQYRLLFIFGLMKIFGDAFQFMIPVFLSIEPAWRCKDNSSVCNLNGMFKPGDENYNFRCTIPRDEWEFDTSEIISSVVTEFDLVCNASALSALSQAVVFLGYMIGGVVGSFLSDKFGRKSMVYFLSVTCNILALAASFVHVYWLYVFIRCLVGFCIGGSALPMFVLNIEYVGKRHRHVVGIALWYFWVISLMLLALFGYLIRDWRSLSIAGAVPGLLQIFFWWFIPESPRWLLVKNKPEQAWKELQKVAEFNRTEMPDGELEQKDATAQRTGDFRDLFSSVNMTKRTLISWFAWMVISLVYYAVSFSAGTFGGNRYLVFFLTSLVEIPSNWTSIVLCRRIGRKKTTVLGVVVSFIASVIAVLFQRDLKNTGFLVANIIMAQGIAKFFINMAYDAIYVYSGELFPTVIRNIGMGTSSAWARIGSISASYIVWLVRIHTVLPYSIVAVLAFVCSALCFLLPETRDAATLENMESVNRNSTEMTEQVQIPCESSKEKEELGELLLKQCYPA